MPSRRRIERDLKAVLGDELGPVRRDRVVRDFFRQRSCETLDIAKISKNPRSYLRLVEVSGRENISAALDGGKGVILCSAHFGGTVICLAVLAALGLPVTAIARWSFRADRPRKKRLIPQRVSREVDLAHLIRPTIRTSRGKENRRGDLLVAVQAAKVLSRNEAIFITMDAPPKSKDLERSVRLNFLNGEVTVLPGAVLIAKLTGAPLLMTLMHYSTDWRHKRLEISPPAPIEGDTTTVLQPCLAFLEAAIRREPAQWRYWGTPGLIQLGLLPADPNRLTTSRTNSRNLASPDE
jgi:KDO2-lipid IV(A) lauroyltransferase